MSNKTSDILTPTIGNYKPLATSKIRASNLISSSLNPRGYLPSEIHEENEIDEAGTTHKKPSMYNLSRNNANANRASYSIQEDNITEFNRFTNENNRLHTEGNESNLSDILADSTPNLQEK
jgi:hypothetical protein